MDANRRRATENEKYKRQKTTESKKKRRNSTLFGESTAQILLSPFQTVRMPLVCDVSSSQTIMSPSQFGDFVHDAHVLVRVYVCAPWPCYVYQCTPKTTGHLRRARRNQNEKNKKKCGKSHIRTQPTINFVRLKKDFSAETFAFFSFRFISLRFFSICPCLIPFALLTQAKLFKTRFLYMYNQQTAIITVHRYTERTHCCYGATRYRYFCFGHFKYKIEKKGKYIQNHKNRKLNNARGTSEHLSEQQQKWVEETKNKLKNQTMA